MRDADRRACFDHCGLRCDTAAPEHRCFAVENRGRLAFVGHVDVADADRGRVADMDGRTVRAGQLLADCIRDRCMLRRVRPHRHHHRPAESAHLPRLNRRAVHRHHFLFVDVTHVQTGNLQSVFERQRAADHEADPIRLPQRRDIVEFFDQFAVAPYAIAGQVGAQIDVVAEHRHEAAAGFGHADQRTRCRIGAAIGGEIVRPRLRQHDEVALRVARRHAAGVAAEACPYSRALCPWRWRERGLSFNVDADCSGLRHARCPC